MRHRLWPINIVGGIVTDADREGALTCEVVGICTAIDRNTQRHHGFRGAASYQRQQARRKLARAARKAEAAQ